MVAHDKLPSKRELTSFYGVSRTTVRLALQELEKMGYIYRQHGKGTFVSELRTNATDLAGAYSFTEQMRAMGKHPETKILAFKKIEATKYLASHLNVQLGEPLFQLDRLRLADDLPMMIEKSYLPVKLFMSLSQEILFLKPLYNLFSENFNQIVRLADEEFYASIVQKEDSELLNIPEGSPVLHLVRSTYNLENEVIEFTFSVARADKFHYKIRHLRSTN